VAANPNRGDAGGAWVCHIHARPPPAPPPPTACHCPRRGRGAGRLSEGLPTCRLPQAGTARYENPHKAVINLPSHSPAAVWNDGW